MKYVVLNEHTLGYLIPGQKNAIGIFHGSVLRGSPHSWKDGWTTYSPDVSVLRAATPDDFRDYHVQLPRDFDESIK